ncbi:MAG: TonB-dependent receptor [Candidatus Acidiferrales bacterium]
MTTFVRPCVYARRFVGFLLVVLVSLVALPEAKTQSQAASAFLEGTVTDETGAVVTSATVEVRRPTTGWVRAVTTDENGRYLFPHLPVGTYDITVTMSGFQPVKYEGIIITVGGRFTRDVALKVSPVTEAVTVTGETPLLETARPTYQQTLNTRSILNLPLIARGFEAFVKLTPGVVDSARNTQSFGGQKGINSNYTIDGADRNNPFFGGQTGGDRPPFVVSMEAIREFVVLNNGFNAEFGRSGAGLVNVVTTSGNNDWHGKAWYYWLEDDFITNTAGTPSGAAPLQAAGRRQQFGGDFSGPIVHDKAFFYFNTDNQKRTVPIALRLITDPADCATITLAPGITPADCDAARQALLDVEEDIAGTDDLWSWMGRVDWHLTAGNTLSGRYNYHKSEQASGTHGFNPFGVTQYAGSRTFFGSELDTSHNPVVTLTSVITPRHINEFRFNYNWEDRPRIQNPIPGANTANGVSDGTAVIVTGITSSRPALGAVEFLPIPETDTRTQVSDNFTYVFGKHDLKFGVDYNHTTVEQVFRGNARGVYTFDNFANFVNRVENRYRQFFGSGALTTNVDELAFFAQDTWRARPNLTISYGLRWEGQYNPSNTTPNTTFPEGTEEIPDDTRMWAPRVGIAWNPTPRAVVRLWGGFFYSRTPMLLMQPPLNNNGDVSGGFTFDFSTGNPCLPAFTSPYAGPYDIPADSPADITALAGCTAVVPGSGQVTGADIRRMHLDFKNSRTFRTGPAFEYELTKNTTVSVSYTYAFSTHLQRLRNINLAPACSAVPLNATYDALCGMGIPVYSTSRRARDSSGNLLFPGVAANVLTESSGDARYHAVTFAVNKRWSDKFQFQTFYTWSQNKSHDDNERDASTRRFYDPFDPDADFARSNLDIPHNFVANGVWELPFGFQVSGLVNWRSGSTIDALTGTDSLSTSLTGASPEAIELIRALVGDPSATVLRSGNGDGNSSPDRPIVNGRVLERNAFRQDPVFQTDMRVAKNWRIGERHRIDSFIDMINIFDTDNFFTTDTRVNSSTFLDRNEAGTPFLFQLGVKYSF